MIQTDTFILGPASYNETMVWPVVPKHCHLVRGTASASNIYEPICRAHTKRLWSG